MNTPVDVRWIAALPETEEVSVTCRTSLSSEPVLLKVRRGRGELWYGEVEAPEGHPVHFVLSTCEFSTERGVFAVIAQRTCV